MKPAMLPKRVQVTIMTVASDPLLDGLKKPKSANTNVTAAMATSWDPEPTEMARSIGRLGGRKTSP